MKKYSHKKRGFTIIEALVAISILTIAVTGPLSLAAKGLSYSNYAKDEITAFYLANEAIDIVRNIRDTNLNSGYSWLRTPNGVAGSLLIDNNVCGAGCNIDVWQYPAELKNSYDNEQILETCINDGVSRFGYDFDSATIGERNNCSTEKSSQNSFTRQVKIEPVGGENGNTNEIRITVKVFWISVGSERSVTITENLFNFVSI